MIPTAISGTWTNAKHGIVDLKAGIIVGISAAFSAPAGTFVAGWISPETGNILFTIFLIVVMLNTLRKAGIFKRRQK